MIAPLLGDHHEERSSGRMRIPGVRAAVMNSPASHRVTDGESEEVSGQYEA
jgi:hypothetical protein